MPPLDDLVSVYIDPSNLTGSASDQNDGRSPDSPLESLGQLVRLGEFPVLEGSTTFPVPEQGASVIVRGATNPENNVTFTVTSGHRRSGRTQQMVLEAVEALNEGKSIAIVAHNSTQLRDIQRRFEVLAHQREQMWRQPSVRFAVMDRIRMLRGSNLDAVLVDHYAIEMATEEDLEELEKIRHPEQPLPQKPPPPTAWERLMSAAYEITGPETAPEP